VTVLWSSIVHRWRLAFSPGYRDLLLIAALLQWMLPKGIVCDHCGGWTCHADDGAHDHDLHRARMGA
jgi:hypothetical protein